MQASCVNQSMAGDSLPLHTRTRVLSNRVAAKLTAYLTMDTHISKICMLYVIFPTWVNCEDVDAAKGWS